MTIDPRFHRIVTAQPYPLWFATISGAQVLPLGAVVGLEVRGVGLSSAFSWPGPRL